MRRPRSGQAARARQEPILSAQFDRLVAFLGAQGDDAWGVLLALVGILLGLAVYFGVLGPVGAVTTHDGAKLFGWGEDVVPIALVTAGVVLIAERAASGLAGALGSILLLLLSSAGLADLSGGNPPAGVSWARLGGAGGVVGAWIAGGMARGIGVAGSGLVVAALAFAAICWMLGGRVTAVVRAVVRAIAGALRLLVSRFSAFRSQALAAAAAEAAVSSAPRRQDPGSANRRAAPGEQRTAGELYDFGGEPPAPDVGERVEVPLAALAAATPESAALVDSEAPGRAPVKAGGMLDPSYSGKAEQLSLPVPVHGAAWRLPPMKLLKRSQDQSHDRREIEERGRVLERALAAHGVETHLVGFTVGPTVTRFELELGAGVKVARVTNLARDIAYAMASPDVRILAPIPGRSAIGVEVPNQNRQLVTVGDVLTTTEARRALHPLEVALGRDIAGRPVMVNLADMPHLLIAGATGAGKSSCINSLVASILMRATPDDVRMILVDPKRVELGQYNGLPHLLTQVVVNPKRAANALNWAIAEMERRYDLLAEAGMRDITGYNAAVDRGDFDTHLEPPAARSGRDSARAGDSDVDGEEEGGRDTAHSGDQDEATEATGAARDVEADGPSDAAPGRLPYILIVVDELNDLMMVAARDVEESICRIAQMARAVGIHLVIATQRPSVDVITGVIKANIPSRLAFSVSSLADSRVILDQPGAERLIGRGDLLLLTASSSVPRRLQGPWVGEDEVRAVVGHWRRQSGPRYVDGVEGAASDPAGAAGGVADDDDELLAAATELVVRSQLGSTSMLQRKLRVGFARAGRLMDLLERRGVVGPSEGSKARAVLMTVEELDQLDS